MKTLLRAAALSFLVTLAVLLFVGVLLAQTLLQGVVARDANLRAGPGTTYAVVGGVKAGQALTIIQTNAAGDWYQLNSGEWIAAFLVTITPSGTTSPVATATKAQAMPTSVVSEAALEKAYLDKMGQITGAYSTALDTFGTQMTTAGNNPTLTLDDEWRTKTAMTLAMFTLLADEVRTLTPPDRMADLHTDVLAAAAHYEKVATLAADGIDQLDADLLRQATTEMQLGQEAIERASAKMQALPTATPTAQPTPTKRAITPTKTPTPIKRTPTATPVAKALFASGGLGLDKTSFEKTHTATGKDTIGIVYDANLIVAFNEDDKVWYIEQQWSDADAKTIEVWSKMLMPTDATLIKTYSPTGRPETTVMLYMSESMKDRFDLWVGGEPGNFIVQYNTYSGRVTRSIISVGNNP
jgi:uncharacterized protein YraI